MTARAPLDPILEMGAARLTAAQAAGELTAEEIMRAHLARIRAVNGPLNAIVSLREEGELLAEARAADAARARGEGTGALHGLPVAIKDLAATKGLRTTQGSPLFADFVPDEDSPMVARIRAAGAIVIGKTNTPEYGLGSHTMNPVFGPTRNPYDRARSAGGSSGGAAVALAMRMLPVADGSDMMGSLRNPAGWNNVWGFRPSWGRCPNAGLPEVFVHQLATDGPMGRTVADMALLLDVQAGFDADAPLSLADEPGGFSGRIEDDPGPLRVGWLGDWGGAWPMEDGILDLCEGALREAEGALGWRVEPVLPDFPRQKLWESWTRLRAWAIAGKCLADYEDPARRAQLKPEAAWEIEQGLSLSALDVHKASEARTDWHRCLEGLFARFDLLAAPTAQVWPFPIDWRWPREIAGVAMDTYHRWMETVLPASLSGRPTVSAPAGFGANGLPMGVQLIGPLRGDLAVLRAARAWERAFPRVAETPPPEPA